MATTTSTTYKNFIGGEWVDAASGETFESTSPANGETIGVFPRSGAEDVDRAVAVAKEAYAEWRLVPAPKRGEILFRLARLLEQEKSALTDLMTHEMGKVKAEAGGDVQEAIDITYYMAGEGRRLFGHTTPSELRDKWNMSIRQPIGVVGAITPWNFPVAIPSWKLIPALVCGNTAVLKPATDTPALAERFVELLAESGIPSGVVNIVHGGGATVGERMVRHPDVRVITLTGSRETGVEVLKAAAETLTHVHLELGGKNAIIVLDDADVELAVDGILWSAFGTSGQRCTAASRVIVQKGAYDALQSQLVERVEKLRLGPGWEDDTDIGPVINRTALEKIDSYTGIGKDEGAKLLTGGEIASDGDLGKGFFYRPTVFADVDPQMRIAQEEIFGPTTALIPVARPRRGDQRLERDQVRPLVLDLHAGRQRRVPCDARSRGRHHVRQRRHDRRRGASPVRRHEGHRQRPPRGGPGGARRVHRVEVDLRRLLRPPAARPDRHRAVVEYRALGDSDLRVSEICLGTWTTFGGSLDEEAAIALVDAAFEQGVNFFDTANIYSEGRSEEVLGRALAKRPRDSFVVATKLCGETPEGDRGLSREQVLKQIDASLGRLQLDHVDLYQCHAWDDDVPVEETLGALTEVVEAGKARFIGVSNWTGDQIRGAVELARERASRRSSRRSPSTRYSTASPSRT